MQKSLSQNKLHLPSPIESYTLFGRKIYIKHDDKIHPYLSGNKFRKLQSLYDTPSSKITTILSYGGTQSNAMLSIATLCYAKGWEFIYYTKRLSTVVDFTQSSNLAIALEHNMVLIECDKYKESIENLHKESLFFAENRVLIAQGGADSLAQKGIEKLAQEIDTNRFNVLHVITPSGTGTTALYLAKSLTCKVLTSACIGNTDYLKTQIQALELLPNNLHFLETKRKYHFAKPYKELYEMYLTCKEAGFEIDMLYATVMFQAIYENLEAIEGDILYIHSGGLIGNSSMLERYRFKGLI